ncbi:salivary peroxidase/catechol oxidase-like [Amblyomma americanum]
MSGPSWLLLGILLCLVVSADASHGAKISGEQLNFLVQEITRRVESRLAALGNGQSVGGHHHGIPDLSVSGSTARCPFARRHGQGMPDFSVTTPATLCPFAGGHSPTQQSLRDDRRSSRIAAICEESTRRLLASLGKEVSASGPVLEHVNQGLSSGQASRFCRAFCPSLAPTSCDATRPFRELDGRCNNLAHPHWGQAYSCERRLLPPAYKDGVSAPRAGHSGKPLPSARLISHKLHPQGCHLDRRLNLLAMSFGQFLSHDITFVPPSPIPRMETFLGPDDRFPEGGEHFDIEVPPRDPFFRKFKLNALPFRRSLACCRCRVGPREQTNSRTSFIDASHIYGTSKEISDSLRVFRGGLLKSQAARGSPLLPQSMHPNNDSCSAPGRGKICFRSGDFRVNQNPGLTTLHTIFLRDHNRIARKLAAINPMWDDERLFQVTKRIVEARLQHVTFNEWLPLFIGSKAMAKYDLRPLKAGFTSYKPNVDPTTFNEFAAAAMRFGHSNIYKRFYLVGPRGSHHACVLHLKDSYFRPFPLYDGVLDSVIRGMLKQRMPSTGRFTDFAITRFLYREPGRPYGSDLVSRDIQRGRDHGIRPYVDYVRLCRKCNIKTFDDLHRYRLIPKHTVRQLSRIYDDVRDIDLYTGGLSEIPVPGAAIGPTFQCIVADMFHRLKWGDRFYYEHGGQAGSFTQGQLDTIRQTTLAKIICENSRIRSHFPRNILLHAVCGSPKARCKDLPDIDLSFWRAN